MTPFSASDIRKAAAALPKPNSATDPGLQAGLRAVYAVVMAMNLGALVQST